MPAATQTPAVRSVGRGTANVPPPIEPGLTSVVIVCADSGRIVHDCVRRVLASGAAFEIVLVDNASSDGHVDSLLLGLAHDARVHGIRNPLNAGFGPACNRGAQAARGDALLFLNPDCLIADDTLARLRELAQRHMHAGLIGVHVEAADGTLERAARRRDPTLRRVLMTLSGLARFERNRPGLAGIRMPAPATPSRYETEAVEAVSGACMYLPRAAFDAIGGFDEGYFLHCEDLDLCRRVRDAGHSVLFAPHIRVRHEQGSSSHPRASFVALHKHRGMWRYFRKFDPAARNPLSRAIVWLGIWGHYVALAPLRAWRTRQASVEHASPAA